MSFWKKVTGKSSGAVSKSESCPGPGAVAAGRNNEATTQGGGARGGRIGLLADFILEHTEKNVNLGQGLQTWDKLLQQSSRLSKTVQEFLLDPASLGYLIQYLEGRDAAHLIRFYLDVQSFRGASGTSLPSSYTPLQVDHRRLPRVPEDPNPSSPTSIEGSTLISESGESVDSGYSEALKNFSDETISESYHVKTQNSDRNASSTDADTNNRTCDTLSSLRNTTSSSRGQEHVNNSSATHVASLADDSNCDQDTDSLTLADSRSETAFQKNCEEDSRAQSLINSRAEDAVKIYRKYIAPDAACPIRIPTEMKREIIEAICDQTGFVARQCFDRAQACVLVLLETDYFPDFLESEYHAKHQVDVLTGGTVMATDILFNDIALFHFMEFMESEGQRPIVEFWMAANNFQQSLQRDAEVGTGITTHDAMILYDKFFSMQATTPLGFDSTVRLEVENNICQETGPGPQCFARPLEITVGYMESRFLDKFLASKLFSNYVKELINKIQMSTRNFSSVPRLSASTESLSSCSSDTNSRMSTSVSRNTLLASGDRLSNTQQTSSESFRIEDGFLTDPDSIWRRTARKCQIGKVDKLGRYHSSWEQAPDTIKDKETIMGRVRRLGRGEHTKLQEDMAWQVAEMFIKDVTSITLAVENSPEFLDENENSERNEKLNYNISLSADTDLEI